MKIVAAVLAASLAFMVGGSPAMAKPPLEAFGDVPTQRAATLSPSGDKLAYISRIDNEDVLMVHDFAAKTSKPLARLPNIKPRSIFFASNTYIVLVVSKSQYIAGLSNRFEASSAYSFNLETGKFVQLLKGTPDLLPLQSGLGRISAVDPDGKHVFMPAFTGTEYLASTYDLLRVDLETGRGSKTGGRRGSSDTIDWFIDAAGKVLAREDFNDKSEDHTIVSYASGQAKTIYSADTALISVHGVSKVSGDLSIVDSEDSDFGALFTMSVADGSKGDTLAKKDGMDIDGLVVDRNRIVHGVQFSGMTPSYEMFDAALNADVKWAQAALPQSSVYLSSWTSDWSKLLFYVSGGAAPERFILMDRPTKKLSVIMNLRREISAQDVGEQVVIQYKSRDGLTIPALLTFPAGLAADKRSNLPLVVMPHGGPASYDQVGFDWLAQFVANEGYMVLQPNFRGSDGFGTMFLESGEREWGRKMQDDVTDGVAALIASKLADPEKVCIVGWSYGGYSALAGGALTPDVYKCVVSIAGVSDLVEMLMYELDRFGEKSVPYRYWSKVIGDTNKDRDTLISISPARQAAKFKAPVLLIHGANDIVVLPNQSDRMNDALKAAGKSVTYLRINGDDHNLTENASRRQTLTALGEFLAKYLK